MRPSLPAPGERSALLLLAAVYFVNLLDFMMVMPLGPDLGSALGIPMSQLGIVGGSYTASACVIGFLGSFLLDRFDRRAALCWSVAGLGSATMAAALARGPAGLILARVAAGAFGGVAGTLCFSILADLVPESRRGRATALVSSGFSASSILGVPAGLELARWGGWRAPFLVVGGLALLLALAARLILPSLRGHMGPGADAAPLPFDRRVAFSFAAFGLAILGNFLLVPNLSAFLMFNRGVSREGLGLLYLTGGLTSLATMRLAGIWTDRRGALEPVAAGTLILIAVLYGGAILSPPILAPALFFAGFMGGSAMRWVAVSALASRVPPPSARARYLSAQNAFAHASSAVAAFASTHALGADPSGRLTGIPALAMVTLALGLGVPFMVWRLEKCVGGPARGPVILAGEA